MTDMNWMIELPILFTAIGFMMARQASRHLWAGVLATALCYWSILYTPPAWALVITWALFLAVATFLILDSLRQNLLTAPLLALYKKILPGMSDTEREALEAGSVWWEAELFSGRPDWHHMLGFAAPTLTAEEQAFLDGPTNELCRMVNDWEITEELRDLTPETWDYLKKKGFFGMIIPERIRRARIFRQCAFCGRPESCQPQHLGRCHRHGARTRWGRQNCYCPTVQKQQKDYYLPRLANGIEIPCFALTGPEAGSDAASMPDSGVVCRQTFEGKEDVLGIRLNWEKRYITLGPVATLLGLAFHLHDPEHLLGESGRHRHHPGTDTHRHPRRRNRQPSFPHEPVFHERPQSRH